MTRKKRHTPKPRCKNGCKNFTTEKTDKGVKRTCTVCGVSVTEVARVVTIDPKGFKGVIFKEAKRKHRLKA